MHIVYYAWVLQNISQLIEIFFPKEVIVFIVDFMRSIIIKHSNDWIDMNRITTIPMQNDNSYLYYDTDEFLLTSNKFKCASNGYRNNFYCSIQCMMKIDNLMQSIKIKKQLFREKWNLYTYHSFVDFTNANEIKMMLHKEPKLIKIIDNCEENIPITSFDNITNIINCLSFAEFIYSLKIVIMPQTLTYGIRPEIKIIKYEPYNPWLCSSIIEPDTNIKYL